MRSPTQALNTLSTHGSVTCLSVRVSEGPDEGLSVTTDGESIVVGTADDCTLTLNDETVSRYHLELVGVPSGIRVVDLESTNGTRVGNLQLERAVVAPGTTLVVGNTRLHVSRERDSIVKLHPQDALGQLRGRSVVMRRLMAQIERLAQSNAGILIVGESGTGKELVAQALHEQSERSAGPFVTVDCGALTESLITSELFGHERGSFTGATAARKGVFERAAKGTVFLDEIGELPSSLQSNLLGVLERRRVRRVGGSDEIDVDVRVISATHRDLRAAVNAGRFRLDLYYRLAVVCISLPPLRERPDDVPVLLQHFLEECGSQEAATDFFSAATLERLQQQPWPGNVRELRNFVEASVAMGTATAAPADEELEPTSTPFPPVEVPFKEARAEVVHTFERAYLTELLARAEGNVSEAARRACVTRSHLFTMLKRHGLK